MFKTAQMKFNLLIAQLSVGKFRMGGLNASAQLDGGKLNVTGSAEKLFSGRLDLAQLSSNLLAENPQIKIQTQIREMNLSEMTPLLNPIWRATLHGLMSGRALFTFPPLRSTNLARDIEAYGDFKIQNFSLGDHSFVELTRSLFPAGIDTTSPQLPTAEIQSQFQLKNEIMRLQPLTWTDNEQNRFELQGNLGFDQKLKLDGNARLNKTGATCSLPATESQGKCGLPIEIFGLVSQLSVKYAPAPSVSDGSGPAPAAAAANTPAATGTPAAPSNYKTLTR